MGNDGGDIPRRAQLVKSKKTEEVATAESKAMGRARFCNLTNQKMKQPLAICKLGCIYNYENILTALVQKSQPERYKYISKLRDIKKVIIEKASEGSENYIVCPITKLEYNGFVKFVGLWTCGHIMSRKAFKQVKIDEKIMEKSQNLLQNPAESQKNEQQDEKEQAKDKKSELQKEKCQKKCIICETPYEDDDVIDLNLQGAEMQKKRKFLLETRNKKKPSQNLLENSSENPEKKVKTQVYLNSLDRLGGQFRDVIRERSKFKELFTRQK